MRRQVRCAECQRAHDKLRRAQNREELLFLRKRVTELEERVLELEAKYGYR